MSGWISIHRKIKDNWLWDDKPYSKGQAWIDLLLTANHKDNKFLLGNELITVERGSFVTSEVKLSESWGWSRTKVRNFLKLLEETEMISRKADNKKTTLTILNYNDYQDTENSKRTSEEHQENNKKTSKEHQKNTNNNDNNDNNVNKIDRSMETEIQLILFKWNKILNTQISELTNNEMLLVIESINKNGIDRVLETIDKISDSKYLLGHITKKKVSIDWFFKDNNFIKVSNDHYKDIKETEKPMINRKTKFHNFEQRSDNYTAEELENIARKKRQAYDKKIEEENQKLREEE